jgi:DcmR-like sensory protein
MLHRGEQELRAAALAFLRPALDRPGEAIFCFGEPSAGERLLQELERTAGRDLSADYRSGRIVVGQPDPDVDQQMENVIAPLEAFSGKGLTLIRFVGIVAWDVPSFPPPEDFLWFESKLTDLIVQYPVTALCPYDLEALPARAIAYGALETHPLVISDGSLRQNPQFIPSDRYLEERLLRLPWLEDQGAT